MLAYGESAKNPVRTHFYAVQVVYCEHCRSLVFVANEAETFLLASLFVAHKIYIDNLAVLREDAYDVTFGKIIW
jgi:hypothetical protein